MTLHFPTDNQICQVESLPTQQEDTSSGYHPATTDKNKSLQVRRIARRSKWLKTSGGYLDYMRYYFSEATYRLDVTDMDVRLIGACQSTWKLETRGEESRFRGIGCGKRDVCPLDGQYYQLVLSRESTRQMLLIINELESRGVELKSKGLKVVLTIPKDVSKAIDASLFDAGVKRQQEQEVMGVSLTEETWSAEVAKIYKLADDWCKQWFPGVPHAMSMDYTGESNPTEPHYHINIYILPASLKVVDNFVSSEPLQRYFNVLEVEAMRLFWRDMLNETYGLDLREAVINIGYLKSEAQLYHWLRYFYRHTLSDLWRGWQYYDDGVGDLTYKYSKKVAGIRTRTTITIPREHLNKAFQRLELIPKKFKRIRWYGSLSDGQRGKTMQALGFIKEERDEDDDGEGKEWVTEGYYNFVRYEPDGVVLEVRDDDDYHATGQLLKVLDDKVTYSPDGVKIGRRIVWLERASPG